MRIKIFLPLILGVCLLAILAIAVFYFTEKRSLRAVENFVDCWKNGFPILESQPRQCRAADGRLFTEEISFPSAEVPIPPIIIFSPQPNEIVSNPIRVSGQAKGNWFFEATFPVKLVDRNGRLVVQSFATALGEWMTTEFVPFSATLNFSALGDSGVLILEKNNPSGLPEHDDSVEIPLRFEIAEQSCRPTGCSGQICSDEEVATTCEFLPRYICFKLAGCERQTSGFCGWTETSEFLNCLSGLE